VECLEDRRLLSISFSGPGNSGVASLVGTPADDQFVVRLNPNDKTMIEFSDDGGASFVDATLSGITAVTVSGLEGNDTLTIDASNGLVAQTSGLPISFDGGKGHNVLVVEGNPSGTIMETFSAASTPGTAELDITDGTVSSTISLTSVASVHDTMTADTLTINADDNDNVIHIHNGPVVNGFKTDTVKIRDVGDVNEDLNENQNDNAQDDHDQGDDGNDHQGGNDNKNDNGDDQGENQQQDEDRSHHARVSISFANKTNVVVNGLGGNDLFLLRVSQPADGLQTLTLDGGSGTNVLVERHVPSGVTLTLKNIQVQATDPDDIFVEELYEERLGRPAAAAEVDLWKTVLQSAGRTAVAQGIEASPEGRTHLVQSWYKHYLGRDAMNGEEQGWVNLLMQGQTEEQVLAGIVGSGEFFDRAQNLMSSGTQNERFVQALYSTLLNRTASAGEVSGWVNALASAGRDGVASGFLGSNEFRNELVTAFYSTLLHRNPDTGGLNAWVSSGQDLQHIREGFEKSDEFFQNG
jgi:hypothetical protein